MAFEDIISGPGLLNVHRALCAGGNSLRSGEALATPRCAQYDSPAAVASGAREGDSTCQEALGLLFDSLAVLAGDLALYLLPGGIYLLGGVVRRNLDLFPREGFLETFLDKEPHYDLLADTPLFVISSDREVGVEGAALRALSL